MNSSLVAFYGAGKPESFTRYLRMVQDAVGREVGPAFVARPVDTLHSTVVGLETSSPGALERFTGVLRERLDDPGITLRFGGYRDRDHFLTSRGRRLYERSVTVDRGQVVLIGWPVDHADRPVPALDALRREAGRCGVRHRYPLTDTDMDPDAHIVLGELDASLPAGRQAAAVSAVREFVAAHPCVVPLRWADLCVVEYDDPRLPVATTRVTPLAG